MVKKIASLALLTILLAMPMAISSVEAVDWDKVVTFNGFGGGEHYMGDFGVWHIEWRVRWRYEIIDVEESVMFKITMYVWHDNGSLTELVIDASYKNDGVRNYTGFQHELITVWVDTNSNVAGFTIKIEEDTDSIPEFTPVALVLFTGSTLAIALSKKIKAKA